MGQYYNVITEDKDGKREYYDLQSCKFRESEKKGSPDYNEYNGLKLMEHSYWENPFCEALAETLVDNPKKVCWCGDYAEPNECEQLGFTKDEIWDRPDDSYIHYEDTDFKMKSVKYLVNVSKKIYIDLEEYYEASKFEQKWKDETFEMCIFPISLLTALGNDRGGGDYYSGGSDYNIIGTWAFDEIYLTNDLPEGYEKDEVCFIEG